MLKIALMFISADVLLAGEFRRIRLQQSVSIKDILSVEQTSVTQCHIKCHSMSACVGYGSQNMGVNELLINCYLLKKNNKKPLTEDELIKLDVVEMVGFDIPLSCVMIQNTTSFWNFIFLDWRTKNSLT